MKLFVVVSDCFLCGRRIVLGRIENNAAGFDKCPNVSVRRFRQLLHHNEHRHFELHAGLRDAGRTRQDFQFLGDDFVLYIRYSESLYLVGEKKLRRQWRFNEIFTGCFDGSLFCCLHLWYRCIY